MFPEPSKPALRLSTVTERYTVPESDGEIDTFTYGRPAFLSTRSCPRVPKAQAHQRYRSQRCLVNSQAFDQREQAQAAGTATIIKAQS